MRSFLKRLPLYLLILAVVGFSLWSFFKETPIPETVLENIPTLPTEPTENTDPPPEFGSYVQVGDTFEYTNWSINGKLLCTVTDVRLVTEESECPPKEWIDTGLSYWEEGNDKTQICYYDDWFKENGPFDQGTRLLLVDLTVENVDAVQGFEEEYPYAFQAGWFVYLTDLSIIDGKKPYRDYRRFHPNGYSRMYEYDGADYGYESQQGDYFKFVLEPGQSFSYTLCFPVYANDDRTPRDLSVLALSTQEADIKNAVCIELDLKEE